MLRKEVRRPTTGNKSGDVGKHTCVGTGSQDTDVGFLQPVGIANQIGILTALKGVGEGRVAEKRQVLIGELQTNTIAGRICERQSAGVFQGIDVCLTAMEILGFVGKVVVKRSKQTLSFRVSFWTGSIPAAANI